MSTPDIPAGWQPDPRGRHEYRYWDGTQWTDHVSDQGQVSTDPVADTTPPASDAEKSQIFSADPATPAAADPAASSGPPAAEQAADEPAATQPEPASEDATVAEEPTTVQPVEPVVATPAAAEPEPASKPEPVVASTPAAGSSAPPAGGTPTGATEPASAQTDAKAAAQDVLHSRSPELATVLTAAVPGSGHFYLGTDKVPLAAGLVAATIAAVVISHMSFLMFAIGFVIWAGAVVFALNDLSGGVGALEKVRLPGSVVGILLIAAGALLLLSLLLPYYRVSAEVSGLGISQSVSQTGNAFQVFDFEDFILLAVSVISIIGGAASLGLGPLSSAELPKQLPTAIAVGGALAVVIIVFRMFIDPAGDLAGGASAAGVEADVSVGRAFGMWLGLWSAIILTLANLGLLRSLTNK